MVSSLAAALSPLRQPPARKGPVFGACVHTTGSGLVAAAQKNGISTLGEAARIYGSSEFYPHYVIDETGAILGVTDEELKAQHIASPSPDEHALYMSVEWRKNTPCARAVELWDARWPGVASPAHLYPGYSPNEAYIGIELVPNPPFTPKQIWALKDLLADIAQRHMIKLEGPRLVGHEDLQVLGKDSRWNANGGWDPGALRDEPVFRWGLLSDA